jgi:hypothetical protein
MIENETIDSRLTASRLYELLARRKSTSFGGACSA